MPAYVNQVWGENFNQSREDDVSKAIQREPAQLPPPAPVRLVATTNSQTTTQKDTYDDLFPAKWWNIFIILSITSIIILLISLHCKVSKLCMMQATLLAAGSGMGGGRRPGPFVW